VADCGDVDSGELSGKTEAAGTDETVGAANEEVTAVWLDSGEILHPAKSRMIKSNGRSFFTSGSPFGCSYYVL